VNINKLLQLVFYLLFLTSVVGLLLTIITTYHLPVMAMWVILTITAAIVYAAVTGENTTNQKKEEK